MKAEQLTGPVAHHGEGPTFCARWAGPRWVDMLAGDILELGPDGSIDRRHVGNVAAIVRARRGRGYVVAAERCIGLATDDDLHAPIEFFPDVWSDHNLRMNEGGCDPAGDFYFGSVAYDHQPGAAALYRMGADRAVSQVLPSVSISNGLEWDPTGSHAYYVDTPTHRIDIFDWSSDQGLHNRRTFAQIAGDGAPDGLTVDAEGGVWVALFGGAAVRRYAPDGSISEVIEIGARQVTAVAFAGPTLDRLIITTSRKGLPTGADPEAGSLFTYTPQVSGLPRHEYGG